MKVRVWIWTIGLAFVGYMLGTKGAIENPMHMIGYTLIGAIVGFGVGWGLQRLLEMGRRH